MKKRIISALCMLSSAAVISTAAPVNNSAQQTEDKKVQKTITLKAKRGTTLRGAADPNIKQDESPNELNSRGGSGIQPAMRMRTTRGVEAIELTSQKGETSRGGADPNIKEDSMPNDMNKRTPKPSKKGGKN